MSYQIDFAEAISRPKIDGQDEERGIDFAIQTHTHTHTFSHHFSMAMRHHRRRGFDELDVNLLARVGISHDESDARWWCDRPSVLPDCRIVLASSGGRRFQRFR